MRFLPAVVVPALLFAHGLAAAFEVKVLDPAFKVTVPALPDISLRQTTSASEPSLRMAGDNGTYKIAVIVTTAQKRVSPRECAGSSLRSILSRPGMPDRDNVYRAPLSASTFLVLYVIADGGQHMLHAHLLSAAANMHCTEVHFSRLERPGEDEDDWRNTFSGARIEEATR